MTLDKFASILGDNSPLISALNSYGLSDESLEKLFQFCTELKAYSEHTNLVSNAELQVVLAEHVLDSLSLLPLIANKQTETLIDIGAGAGFPGMILAIALPELKVTLMDSIGKKCKFLELTADKLGFNKRKVKVCCERAETLGHDTGFRGKYDAATARAVASLPVVAELCLPFLKVGGTLYAQRSKRQAEQELPDADAYVSRLGGKLLDTVYLPVDPVGRELSILKIAKVKPTSSSYPRTAAQIKRETKP